MIWSKAIKDSSGLRSLLEKNQNTWKYPNRIKTEIYTSPDKKTAKKTYKLLKRDIHYDSILKIVNQNDLNVKLDNKILDNFNDLNKSYDELKKGITKPISINGKFIVLLILMKN